MPALHSLFLFIEVMEEQHTFFDGLEEKPKCSNTSMSLVKREQDTSTLIKYTYSDRRSAGNILRRHEASDISTPTSEWLKKVEWARKVLPDFYATKPKSESKRQGSKDCAGPSAKRSRTQAGKSFGKSFADIAKEKKLIGVMDQGHSEGKISHSNWKWVEAALARICMEMIESNPGSIPACKDVGWYQGKIKMIACDDQRSVDLYKCAVLKVGEIYPGARLIAVDWSEMPRRPRARFWTPSSIREPAQILKMLQCCNPDIPTHDWQVVKVDEMEGPTIQVIILLNRDSLAPIEAAKGKLNFGFSTVHVKVYKSDTAAGLVPTGSKNLESELEVPDEDGYLTDTSILRRGMESLCREADLSDESDLDAIIL